MITALTTADFDGVTRLGQLYYEEARIPGRLNPEHFKAMLEALAAVGKLVAYGKKIGGELVGVIMGLIDQELYTGELVATMMCYYVMPEYRRHGGLLFRAWERESIECGVVRLQAAHLTPFNAELMQKIYERFGYRKSEIFYTKIVKE